MFYCSFISFKDTCSIQRMPNIQVIVDCLFLQYFTCLGCNFSKKIEFLIFNAIKHKFNFNVLTNPIYVIQKQIQLPLSIFPVIH